MLTVGLKGQAQTIVNHENTAEFMGSGTIPVFATPAMVALMEAAAMNCVAPYLEAGTGTVGTLVQVKHLAATPLTLEIRAQSTLTEIDGKRLVFAVTAYDQAGLIGEGVHERFVIDERRFIEKTNRKIVDQ